MFHQIVSDKFKGTTINDQGARKKLRKKNFGGPSQGKKIEGLPPGKKAFRRKKKLEMLPPPDH